MTSDHADRAVARFEAAPDEQRNLGSERMARLQQVRARLALGQLEGASDALAPVLDIAPAVSLIDLNRDNKAYEWTDIATVRLGTR